jgi:hypothetical protein
MVKAMEALAEDFEGQKKIIEELFEMVFRLQARVSAISEVLIKEDITDAQELQILEMDNLNTIQYALERD